MVLNLGPVPLDGRTLGFGIASSFRYQVPSSLVVPNSPHTYGDKRSCDRVVEDVSLFATAISSVKLANGLLGGRR